MSTIVENLPRMNNNIGEWHGHMQANINARHPNFWHFFVILRREQALNKVIITKMLAGKSAQPQRQKYRSLTQRLRSIVADYDNRPFLYFLHVIGHNIQW